ncbi:hypothetical protein [Aquimarina latercula]|uniref:hypothetical protein n=1 Tax=Aquimarina latercula TaxID=987 RepID=UPI000484F133|nr:hypothetical protein [Aquimarina latercula]
MQLQLRPILLVLTVLLFQITSVHVIYKESLFVTEYSVFSNSTFTKNTGNDTYNATRPDYLDNTLRHYKVPYQLVDGDKLTIKSITASYLNVSGYNYVHNPIKRSTSIRFNSIKTYNVINIPRMDKAGIKEITINI